MAGYRRYELIEHTSPFYFRETSIFSPFTSKTRSAIITRHTFPPPLSLATAAAMEAEELSLALDVFNPPPSLFNFSLLLDPVFEIETAAKRIVAARKQQQQKQRRSVNELYLETLCDRVSALERKFDRMLLKPKDGDGDDDEEEELQAVDRKYTWTSEVKSGAGEKKYKVSAEIKGDGAIDKKNKHKKKKGKVGGGGEKCYKWEAEFKGKGDEKRSYSLTAKIGGKKKEHEEEEEEEKFEKKKKEKKKKEGNGARIVEIEDEGLDHRTEVLRQAYYARRGGGSSSSSSRGKKKELSPQDAAMMIQLTFRDYLIRRSRALRALRELAVAKTKLKEIRALFHNFSYRSRVARDAEERQKFTERIIVLLLTVDAIEGVDVMVRSAKRSMVDELEAMLDFVDPPQPGGGGRSLSMMRRRTFDMPSGEFNHEMAREVDNVVRMLDEEENASEA